MLFPFTKKFKATLLLVIVSLPLIWVVESSASGLFDWEVASSESNSSLPHVILKEGADLTEDGRVASKKQVPILLFFSMKHCPFCIEVEEDYLKPLLRNLKYNSKVMIRKIRIDETSEIRDFKGQNRDASEFSEEYSVAMVPTLILVDSQGKIISPAIVGIRNAHYYSGDLDDAIDASLQKIRAISQR
jgi:thioredoxin-related protein